jgi:hypothetical protein
MQIRLRDGIRTLTLAHASSRGYPPFLRLIPYDGDVVLSAPRPFGYSRRGIPLSARAIPDTTIAALRELLVRMSHEEAQASTGDIKTSETVRDALRALSEDARSNGVRVEQLVIAIKQGWSILHEDKPRPRSAGPDDLLNQVITLCIDTYYAPKVQS